jgi:carbon-monoxide dehydrogenase medium subunit
MRYQAPGTIDEAVAVLAAANGGAQVLAGGTDLLVQLRAGMIGPEVIVDIKRIPELRAIAAENGGFRLGAAVAGAEMGEHAALKASWPGVVEAMELIGSTQIQGRATPGGNLCNASPAADCVPAMVAASAVCTIAGPTGRRDLSVGDVVTGPGQTALGKGEFVVDFRLPERPPRSGDAYLRFIPRTEMDIAVVGAGVNVTLDYDGVCTAAQVVLGAVAPRILLVPEAAAALVGARLDDDALGRLDAACRAACRPIDDKRGTIVYRTKVSGVLARRAAAIAFERARTS